MCGTTRHVAIQHVQLRAENACSLVGVVEVGGGCQGGGYGWGRPRHRRRILPIDPDLCWSDGTGVTVVTGFWFVSGEHAALRGGIPSSNTTQRVRQHELYRACTVDQFTPSLRFGVWSWTLLVPHGEDCASSPSRTALSLRTARLVLVTVLVVARLRLAPCVTIWIPSRLFYGSDCGSDLGIHAVTGPIVWTYFQEQFTKSSSLTGDTRTGDIMRQ